MVLYLDIVIFLNFITNYCFMEIIYLIQNEKINILRILLSSIISILLLLSFLINYIIFNFIKIFGGVILILLAFKYKNKKGLIYNICLYYILQFSYIGLLSIFNIKGCICIFIILLTCLIFLILFKITKIQKQSYNILLKINNKQLNIEGYLDTGNNANYYGIPIIFLDKKYYDNNLIVNKTINIKTIKGIEFINCYKPDYFYILDNNEKIKKEVLIAFTHFDNNIICLLNNLLFI